MVETAVIIPVLGYMLFGIFEFGLLMFSVGESRWSAAEGARVVSEQGILVQKCSAVAGCSRLDSGIYTPGTDCNADCQALSVINLGPLGTTSIATVDEIDITKLYVDPADKVLKIDLRSPCQCMNSYTLKGVAITNGVAAYPATTRNVTLGSADYVELTIKYHYAWRTPMFQQFGTPNQQATYDVKLEPQRF